MRHLAVVTGPMSGLDLKTVKWSATTDLVSLPCTGGSANCDAIVNNLLPRQGKLDWIAQRSGHRLSEYDRVCLVSFSAGHGFMNTILKDPEVLNRVDAICAIDSYYGMGVKQGYLAFARLAAQGRKLAFFSTSDGRDATGTSEECMQPFLRELGVGVGDLPDELRGVWKGPITARPAGGFLQVYLPAYSHAVQVPQVGTVALQRWVSPRLTSGEFAPRSYGAAVLALGGVALAGVLAWLSWRR